jgi:hypothetical protein
MFPFSVILGIEVDEQPLLEAKISAGFRQALSAKDA